MMSKERDLLKKWVSQFGNLRHDFNLLTETKELLTQPEQPKQEPLSEQTIWNANTEQLFEEGVRWAEQQHRIIGGGE
jgi:hypothetical protein